jgi:hypothetical protein
MNTMFYYSPVSNNIAIFIIANTYVYKWMEVDFLSFLRNLKTDIIALPLLSMRWMWGMLNPSYALWTTTVASKNGSHRFASGLAETLHHCYKPKGK